MRLTRLSLCLLFCCVLTQLNFAQEFTNIGRPTYTTSFPVELGFINVANGNLHLEIPIVSWPQRGGGGTATYNFVYDSRYSEAGWRLVPGIPPDSGAVRYTQTSSGCPGSSGWWARYTNFVFDQMDGTRRTFQNSNVWTEQSEGCPGHGGFPNASGHADDGSGYRIVVTNYTNARVFAPDGREVTALKDNNGNFYNFHPSLPTWIDTLGRNLAIRTTDAVDPNIEHYDVINSDGSTARFTVTYATYNVWPGWNIFPPGTLKLMQSLQLPNGSSYTFDYQSGTSSLHLGALTRITLPTGGTIEYAYGQQQALARSVASRTSNGGQWTFTPTFTPATQTVTDPSGNQTVYEMNAWNYLTNARFYSGAVSGGQLLKTATLEYDIGNRLIRQTTTLPSGLTTKFEYSYVDTTFPFRDRNISQIREWDYYTGAPPGPTRTTDFTYLDNPTYSDKNIIDRVTAQSIFNSAGALVAKTEITHDGTPLTATSGVPQHDYTNFGSGNTVRGNPTHIKRWLNTTGGWLITTNNYDDLGNLRSTIDPGGHSTTFDYTDDWAQTSCSLSNTQAYVTLTTNHLGHRTRNRYYTCTGLVQSTRDENDIVAGRAGTTFTYDALNRPAVTVYPEGGQTTNTYNDTALPASVTTLSKIDDSKNLSQTTIFDGFARTQQTRLVDPDCASGPVKVDFTFDVFGRKATESNPYCTTSDSTYGVTTYKYDVLSRINKVIPPDGTESSNHVSTVYSDDLTTVTDQAGKVRRTKSDAYGRLVAAWEPNAGGSLVNQTIYAYDALDNLLCVEQRGTASSANPCGHASNPADWRTRQFVYDSLSRLIKATNPESGTICYGVWNAGQCVNGYDVDGNLLAQTDARNITINHSYDQLHRLTGKTYSNGDPSVSYCYDLASCTTLLSPITNGVGRRIRMSDGSGVSAWSYDPLGR